MLQFEKYGYAFRANRLNARQQGHLARRLAPLLPPLAPLFAKVMEDGGKDGAEVMKRSVFEFLGQADAFADALADMKNEHWDTVLDLALGSLEVRTNPSPEAWMTLWMPGAAKPIVEELNDMGKLLPLVVQVIQFNLGNFIDGFLTRHEEPSGPGQSGAPSPATRTGSGSR